MNNDIKTKFIYDSLLYYANKIVFNKSEDINTANIYIRKLADKISANFDRRNTHDLEFAFLEGENLYSIFNILNKNNESKKYDASILYENEKVNVPKDIAAKPNEEFYKTIKEKLSKKLEASSEDMDFINSFLELLEQTTSYMPVSKEEKTDISVYEHIKQSIAIGSVIFEYLTENGKLEEQEQICSNPKGFYSEKSMLLYSMDWKRY